MITESLKSRIESYASDVFVQNPFFKKSEDGKLNEKQVKYYLNNVFFLFQRTTIYLKLASTVADQLGQKDLARFYLGKQKEEVGHDKWAQNDLRGLGEVANEVDSRQLSPVLRDFMNYISDTIKRDPKLYLCYMVFAEYFTVLVATRFLDNLENKCGIPRSVMTSIANHGELDREHAVEDFQIIEKNVAPEAKEEFDKFLECSIDNLDRFFCEVAELDS